MPYNELPPKPTGVPVTWSAGADTVVTATSGEILAANSNRKALLIINTDTTADRYVRIRLAGGTATATTGVALKSQGGAILLGPNECPTGSITAIRVTAADQTISALEAT